MGNTATNWGINQEQSSEKDYLLKLRENSPHISKSPSGLVISLDHPWIAASPCRWPSDRFFLLS